MVSKIVLTDVDGVDLTQTATTLLSTMGAVLTNETKILPVSEDTNWREWLDTIESVDVDALNTLSLDSRVNSRTLNKELHAHDSADLTVSHVTRVFTFVDTALESDIMYSTATEQTLQDCRTMCSEIMTASGVDGICESSVACNQAAVETDHTPGWDGTGEEIDVCADHYRGLEKDDMPIDEKHYQTEPGSPRVEGVDEVRAHRNGGMAEVAHLRQTKEELRDKDIL